MPRVLMFALPKQNISAMILVQVWRNSLRPSLRKIKSTDNRVQSYSISRFDAYGDEIVLNMNQSLNLMLT